MKKKRTYTIKYGSNDGGGGGTFADLMNSLENKSESITGIKGKDWNSRGGQSSSRIDDVKTKKSK